MKRHSDEFMASADTVGAYAAATTRSPPRSRPNLVTISNVVQSNFVSQAINNPNIQFNAVQPFNASTMPVLAINDKIPGSLPGGSTMPALHTIQSQHSIQQIRQKIVPSTSIIQQQQQQQQQQQTQFQRLKVEDALSYLDQVKFKFSNQPQVYNDFLDIMKEFKSQSIDTPGVITRVSNLFKGHPELIVGFNTFLPPGYKIEIKNNELGFHVSVSIPQSPAITSSQTIIHSTTQHIMSSTQTVTNTPNTVTTTPPVVIKPAVHLPINQVNTTSVVMNHHTTHNSMTPTVPSSSFHPTQIPLSVSSLSQVASNIPQVSIPTTQESTNSQNQPVEFNHAINYVNKIKNRFQGQPEKYKRFLEILHTYQKEQKTHKDNVFPIAEKTLTEAEVYQQVAKLFENQEDLLIEFGQFLPDAKTHDTKQAAEVIIAPKKTSVVTSAVAPTPTIVPPIKKEHPTNIPTIKEIAKETSVQNVALKRTSSFSSSQNLPPPKRPKSPFPTLGDVSYVEAYKYGSLTDFAYFDLVRKSIQNAAAYEDFLRCLVLYYTHILSKSELLNLVQPFLGKYSELFRRFKDFIGTSEKSNNAATAPAENKLSGLPHFSLLDPGSNRQDRSAGDLPTDIDFSICKRLGASYCTVPTDYKPPKCSGRTKMCYEVLNDTLVSFPTWSEESSFATCRKIQYEEYMHKCEDERFELDLVMEINLSAIYALEDVLRKFNRMTPEEVAKFKLDDSLSNDTSTSTFRRAMKRIYGDKMADMFEGLRKRPLTVIPLVLKRLKSKDEEWKEARNNFNEIWKSQNEKYYLKSLDHQGVNFKQSDMKFLRSKSLLNEIETLYDERNEQSDINSGPHMVVSYTDKSILDDAANLLIHHVKRQASINKEDKQKIKLLLRRFIPDLFHHSRQELSDDEHDGQNDCSNNNSPETTKSCSRFSEENDLPEVKITDSKLKVPEHSGKEECYTLFFGNNYWYLFLRLHHILCDRLTQIYKKASQLVHDECIYQVTRSESAASKLRLNPKSEILLEDYYPALLDMIKNVLDGNMDSNTYEDTLREMFGIHAFVGFTLDKVVVYAVRQLHHIVTDEHCQECCHIFLKESKKNGTGGLCSTACQRVAQEAAYQRKIEAALANDNNCYKIFIYKSNCKLTFELLDTDTDDNQDSGKWTNFDNEPLSETNDDKPDGNQSPKD